jgi:hypothetical protein
MFKKARDSEAPYNISRKLIFLRCGIINTTPSIFKGSPIVNCPCVHAVTFIYEGRPLHSNPWMWPTVLTGDSLHLLCPFNLIKLIYLQRYLLRPHIYPNISVLSNCACHNIFPLSFFLSLPLHVYASVLLFCH